MDPTISAGLEQGPDGATRVHAFGLPGCTATGASPEQALAALPREIAAWLGLLRRAGERVPPEDTELEITVDEWITTDADVAADASDVCFAWDREPLSDADVDAGVRRLGDVRGMLLDQIRARGEAALDRAWVGEWSARRVAEELARAQWWTLSRLGASPLADSGGNTVRRLDTALALAVQQLTHLPTEARDRALWLDDEEWTPRKVLRRLLWLEWSLARPAAQALQQLPEES